MIDGEGDDDDASVVEVEGADASLDTVGCVTEEGAGEGDSEDEEVETAAAAVEEFEVDDVLVAGCACTSPAAGAVADVAAAS